MSDQQHFPSNAFDEPIDRRRLLKRAVGATAALGLAPYVARTNAFAATRTIRIGIVLPRTGSLASFGEAMAFTTGQMQKVLSKGIRVGNNTFPVEIISRDSESNTTRAATVAQSLILDDNVDLMLTGSTPLTANPVSDVCEANGTPCIATQVPWQSWFFGRNGDPAKGFNWTYNFFWGLEDIEAVFMDMWGQVKTNKVVGALYPNDPDGNAWGDKKTGFPPVLAKRGFKLVDPGRYTQPNDDFSSHIAAFKRAKVQIASGVPLPPDVVTFVKQMLQQGLRPPVVTVARALLYPTDVQALGKNGNGVSTEVWWHPDMPYRSSLTRQTATALASQYTQITKRQWTQPIGFNHALFEVAANVFGRVKDPDDKKSIIEAIKATDMQTITGRVTWKGGPLNPVPGVCKTKLAGGQWRKGKKYPYEMVVVSNKQIPALKRGGKLEPIAWA